MKRPRKVFGRVLSSYDGKMYWVEQRMDGIHVRQRHHRKDLVLPHADVIRLSQHQGELWNPGPSGPLPARLWPVSLHPKARIANVCKGFVRRLAHGIVKGST